MSTLITQRLLLILAGVALLSFAGSRKWLRPNEVGWVGAAMIFAATGWMLQAILNITRADFTNKSVGIAAGFGLTAPLVIALSIALAVLVRRLKRRDEQK